MTEILLCHLERQPVEKVLPNLVDGSLAGGWQAASEERLRALCNGFVGAAIEQSRLV